MPEFGVILRITPFAFVVAKTFCSLSLNYGNNTMSQSFDLTCLEQRDAFVHRHIGPDPVQIQAMLADLDVTSLDALSEQIVPDSIYQNATLQFAPSRTEQDVLAELKGLAQQNTIQTSMIGQGYYDTLVPNVILRNVLENPGWYTAYTPYQAEISQGRLQALLNYQQMIIDLTGMELANASLLDEATAAAEAMTFAKRSSKNKQSNRFFVDQNCFSQTIDVLKTRAEGFGFELIIDDIANISQYNVFGALLQYPNKYGAVIDLTDTIAELHQQKAIASVAADLLSLTLLKEPGVMGADVVLGSTQRFGVPMGFGGPHAAYFACKDVYKRAIPGRIIGVSIDSHGKTALRMALQTREQHIRREKANSNICTAQVLLANMAGFYAVYHGPKGLSTIAQRIHRLASILAHGLSSNGIQPLHTQFFDTISVDMGDQAVALQQAASQAGINIFHHGNGILSISCDEKTSAAHIQTLFDVLLGTAHGLDVYQLDTTISAVIPDTLQRDSAFLTHNVFNRYHSESEMLRYIKQLEDKDLALNRSMISLGSCTMKLNATAEMIPITWPEFTDIHPFAPLTQATGYLAMITQLEQMLAEITGFDAVSMQPNSGAQGEYAGLLVIQKYHQSRGETQRNVCLIPRSAHGTNPASAQMLNMQIVVVACDENGNVDLADLRSKAAQHQQNLSCIMITYPSTHGVYESAIVEICEIIHQHGGQVYMDGANLNAQVGLTKAAVLGADVSHMNLHKTFCIPHGGGGPGMGPIGLKQHLAPFVANHAVQPIAGVPAGNSAVSAAPWGSAAILPISWIYIQLMGSEGLRKATQVALLNANYLASKLAPYYPVLYTGENGRVAHECIIDLRPIKSETGITEVDIAKRLMDYGFHAPTMSFPVPGTFMIEPTESESKAELDRFIDAMIAIWQEIEQVRTGQISAEQSALHHAPHTLADIVDANWDRPYSREQAAFPLPYVAAHKFWSTVNRIDDVYGDRNLICSCPSVESYEG